MWKMVQCAVQGRGHIKADIPCQDKTYCLEENGVYTIALADGAGSASLSHFGAEFVVKYVCEQLCTGFDEIYGEADGVVVKQRVAEALRGQLEILADEYNCSIKELASTLLAVATKDNKYIIIHIGDGVIGYLKDGKLGAASKPDNGEFANTTVFTTSPDMLANMRMLKGETGSVCGFVLMSDGTADSLYNKRENRLAGVLKKIMQNCVVMPAEMLEEQLRESFEVTIRAMTTDDCSIAIMVDTDGDLGGYLQLSDVEKANLFGFNTEHKMPQKSIGRYDYIIESLVDEPKALMSIAREIHLKPKYTKRHLDKLARLSLIEKNGNKYKTIVMM